MEDVGRESIFNEAALKMKRIHDSQTYINSLNINMLAFDNKVGKYHYEIMCSEYLNLLGEVWGKLSNKEKDESMKWQRILMDSLEKKKIFIIECSESLGYKKKYLKKDEENWNFVKEIILQFGNLIREYLESHGMSGQNRAEEEGW